MDQDEHHQHQQYGQRREYGCTSISFIQAKAQSSLTGALENSRKIFIMVVKSLLYKDLNNMQQAKQVGGRAIVFHKKCGPSSKSSRYCDTLCEGRVVLLESESKV